MTSDKFSWGVTSTVFCVNKCAYLMSNLTFTWIKTSFNLASASTGMPCAKTKTGRAKMKSTEK